MSNTPEHNQEAMPINQEPLPPHHAFVQITLRRSPTNTQAITTAPSLKQYTTLVVVFATSYNDYLCIRYPRWGRKTEDEK